MRVLKFTKPPFRVTFYRHSILFALKYHSKIPAQRQYWLLQMEILNLTKSVRWANFSIWISLFHYHETFLSAFGLYLTKVRHMLGIMRWVFSRSSIKPRDVTDRLSFVILTNHLSYCFKTISRWPIVIFFSDNYVEWLLKTSLLKCRRQLWFATVIFVIFTSKPQEFSRYTANVHVYENRHSSHGVSANVGCDITTEEAYQFALLRIVW